MTFEGYQAQSKVHLTKSYFIQFSAVSGECQALISESYKKLADNRSRLFATDEVRKMGHIALKYLVKSNDI